MLIFCDIQGLRQQRFFGGFRGGQSPPDFTASGASFLFSHGLRSLFLFLGRGKRRRRFKAGGAKRLVDPAFPL